LNKLYPGDELRLRHLPNLTQIIQLGHTSIRGTIKFKDSIVYADPRMTPMEIPENNPDDIVYETYAGSK
jgi:hypothetical protein